MISAEGSGLRSARFAVKLMIGQAVLFATETAAIHHIGSQMPVMLLAFFRATAGLVLAVVLARGMGISVLRTRHLPLQLGRGVIGLMYLWVMVYSFTRLPFADATAISYTQAAYIAIFSAMILQEAVTPLRWLATATGIVGAVCIAQPAFSNWNSAYLVALSGTSLNGLGFVLNRYLQQDDSEATTMFYTNLIPVLGNLPVLFMADLPGSASLVWLPAILLFGPIGMYLGIVAVRHADSSMLGPYTFLRLVIGLAGGVLLFHERPNAWSTVGAALIVASCLLSWHSGRSLSALARKQPTLTPASG